MADCVKFQITAWSVGCWGVECRLLGRKVSAVGSLLGNFSYEITPAYPYLYQRERVGRDAGAHLGCGPRPAWVINILYYSICCASHCLQEISS